jgi:hypothetical protein
MKIRMKEQQGGGQWDLSLRRLLPLVGCSLVEAATGAYLGAIQGEEPHWGSKVSALD